MDLAELTIDVACLLIGTTFAVALPNGGGTELRLEIASGHGAGLASSAEPEIREPFSLLFLGDRSVVLPQGMYDIRSNAACFEGIFLVPIGHDGYATQYEAVFS